MDYGRDTLAERLAAEYSLGTLRGGARRRFEALLPAHPALQSATTRWQQRLAPLTGPVAPVDVPEQVWRRIETRLFGAPVNPPRWWQRLGLWRATTAMSGAMVLGLSLLAVNLRIQQSTDPSPLVIVLAASAEVAQGQHVSFVAGVSADGRAIVVKPLQGISLEARKVLELWAIPAQGAPRSLGLLTAEGTAKVLRSALLQDTAALAISVEPTGGSPTGAPTGPVVSVGQLKI
jgi:anti-sigma-K factor RskA